MLTDRPEPGTWAGAGVGFGFGLRAGAEVRVRGLGFGVGVRVWGWVRVRSGHREEPHGSPAPHALRRVIAVGNLHPLVISVAAVQQLDRLVHPHALRLQIILRGVQPEGTALTLVSLRHATLRGERAQDAWPEQRRPDDAEPVLLHAACLSIELPAVVLLQVGDEGIREVGSTRHPREAASSTRREQVYRQHGATATPLR